MEKLKGMCTETHLTNRKIETQRRLNTLGVIFITNKEKADRSCLWDSELTHGPYLYHHHTLLTWTHFRALREQSTNGLRMSQGNSDYLEC